MNLLDPDQFRGKPAEFQAWAAEHFAPNPNWCARHWAPCPVEGRNGIAASLELMKRSLDRMPRAVRRGGPGAMNSYMANWTTPTCCWLGDDEMAKVWAAVPGPADGERTAEDRRRLLDRYGPCQVCGGPRCAWAKVSAAGLAEGVACTADPTHGPDVPPGMRDG